MSDELNTIFPGTDIKLSSGEVVTIKPLTFGQFPRAAKLAKGIVGPLAEVYNAGSADDANSIVTVISEGGEDFLLLLSFGISKPREFFDTLGADDGVRLARAFFEVNLNFFTQRVLPEMEGFLKVLVPGQ